MSRGRTDDRTDPLHELERLHGEMDVRFGLLATRHAARFRCERGCGGCCVDHITVFDIEAELIRRHHRRLLSEGRPHAVGSCAFLDDHGECRIYDQRPYVCRSQGLPLRWLDRDDAGQTVEFRDICPLNERESEPIEALSAEDCWTIGPVESRLARLALDHGGDPPERVFLRALFER